jgi:diguanylate cyclase (GGDEF)-like protein/PAS domain S-box-containing protein
MPSYRRLPGERNAAHPRTRSDLASPPASAEALVRPPGPVVGVHLAEAEADRFFQLSADLLCILDTDERRGVTRLRRVNPAWGRTLGLPPDTRLIGTPLLDLVHPDDREAAAVGLAAASTASGAGGTPGPAAFSARFRAADGTYRWLQWSVSAPDTYGLRYATARDVTEGKEAEAAMLWQASHDALTGLPNRTLLQDRLSQALASATRRGNQLAVLFLDLDRFKPINDTLGHAAGDALLKEMAARMRAALREEDTVARLGGDEFVILLPNIGSEGDALQVANKLLHHISQSVYLLGHEMYVTASIGVSLFPQDGRTPEVLVRNADLAMYRAKEEGRSRAAVHNEASSQDTLERVMLQSRLRQAMDRQELLLHYQPQVSLLSGEVIGVEALMRWRHQELGFVSPAKFIPLAEETGLIVPLGGWAVQEAVRQAADWVRGGTRIRMSVNLSASQLTDGRFPGVLQQHLTDIGLSARSMDLELTESTFLHDDSGALETLHRLKAMGVRLSVDDFGTGYSSLAYLRRFPLDAVKVDRSFITNLEHSPADLAVVRAVIDLSHTLGLRVVAEGVETAGQYDRLRALGCDAMQGHFFSAAIPPRDVPGLVAGAAVSSGMGHHRNGNSHRAAWESGASKAPRGWDVD